MQILNRHNRHWVLAAFWLLGVSVALLGMYARNQGELPAFPVAALVVPASDLSPSVAQPVLPTLRMFVHPQCPCTRASVRELERLVARCQGKLNIEVYFFKPGQEAEDWVRTAVWRTVQSIPGAHAFVDTEGVMARRYAAQRSGQVVLQSAAGSVLFTGGITDSSGHEGDNAGRSAVEAWVSGRRAESSTPVYGCEIF